jgi:hypothetical protein
MILKRLPRIESLEAHAALKLPVVNAVKPHVDHDGNLLVEVRRAEIASKNR